MEALSGPTQFVILGGSGDLSKRKLLPALIDLYTKKALPERFRIIGLARTKRTNEEYRTLVAEAIKEHAPKHTTEHIAAFCEHIEYVSGSFTEASSYTTLKTMTDDYASSIGQCTNVLFYLAVPPTHYSEIFEQLHKEGFAGRVFSLKNHLVTTAPRPKRLINNSAHSSKRNKFTELIIISPKKRFRTSCHFALRTPLLKTHFQTTQSNR